MQYSSALLHLTVVFRFFLLLLLQLRTINTPLLRDQTSDTRHQVESGVRIKMHGPRTYVQPLIVSACVGPNGRPHDPDPQISLCCIVSRRCRSVCFRFLDTLRLIER
ncbi:hypothetical protein B0T09DRAFT_349588 [Sordaria sp. MPI-SDFR-AT-0083]|nr:hypothetical protein B0T09DRAFT_349588 [Sordaria sp. MPI-SDFR-AT-0083]